MKLEELQHIAEDYLAQIDSLAEANQMLATENEDLKVRIQTEQKLRAELMKAKQQLEEQLGIYSTPKVENVLIIGIHLNSKGEEKQTFNVAKINKLKVCFDVAESNISDPMDKEVYLTLVGPQGEVVVSEETGSGTFTKLGSIEKYPYTSKIIITLDKKRKNVCMYSQEKNTYDPGNYRVELYADGNLIGSAEFELR